LHTKVFVEDLHVGAEVNASAREIHISESAYCVVTSFMAWAEICYHSGLQFLVLKRTEHQPLVETYMYDNFFTAQSLVNMLGEAHKGRPDSSFAKVGQTTNQPRHAAAARPFTFFSLL
jgi:hypothetical protein